jgi:GNAT superfamily N-acetyltransferase
MMIRPGRAADLEALIGLWHAEVRAGTRDSVPREIQVKRLLAQFDWGAKSRVLEDGAGSLSGAVLVSSRPSPEGVVARIDPAATEQGSARTMGELVRWALQLSRASGAAAAQVWVGPGHGQELSALGLEMVRPWLRMDRDLGGDLAIPATVEGYRLLDGSGVPGPWADMHNRSFADHWRFSQRSEEELMAGKQPGLCLMAVTASGEPAAVTLCQVETFSGDQRPQPVGLVSSVGTLPEHRRRGLASWLVAEGLLRLQAAGSRCASLYVDGWNQSRAVDAYTKLGFDVAFVAEVWEAVFT